MVGEGKKCGKERQLKEWAIASLVSLPLSPHILFHHLFIEKPNLYLSQKRKGWPYSRNKGGKLNVGGIFSQLISTKDLTSFIWEL